MENIKMKTPEELEAQLGRAETLFGGKIEPSNVRAEMLTLSTEELKERYPQAYQGYFSFLKTEARLLSFPDLDVAGETDKPRISLLNANARGSAFKVSFANESHVIKPLESNAEKDTANRASDLGIGPKQFETKDGFLHEEFIDGTPLLDLEKEKCTPEYMKKLGNEFAKALKKLHENNILVNDQILTDDNGKSHMIIDKSGAVRFIDFGASIDISHFPELSDEEVESLMRTDPMMAFALHNHMMEPTEGGKAKLIGEYRRNILSRIKTKADLIKMKDMQLLNEGLHFLSARLPNVDSYVQGVVEGLK